MLFNVHPWQMVHAPDLKRTWYEQAALRHLEHEQERANAFLEAIGSMLGAS